MARNKSFAKSLSMIGLIGLVAGCSHFRGKAHSAAQCEPCADQAACNVSACSSKHPCGECESCCGKGAGFCGAAGGFFCRSSNAVPDVLPLGSSVRAFDQVMQTNAEAVDFVVHRLNFVGQTAELTSDGKDQILEIAARMRSTPFPVVIEREPNNSDPELDAVRRNLVAQILTDLGNPDAQQRTVVGMPYGPGYWSMPAQMMYYQHTNSYGNNFGFGGGGGVGMGGGGGVY